MNINISYEKKKFSFANAFSSFLFFALTVFSSSSSLCRSIACFSLVFFVFLISNLHFFCHPYVFVSLSDRKTTNGICFPISNDSPICNMLIFSNSFFSSRSFFFFLVLLFSSFNEQMKFTLRKIKDE